MTHHEYSPATDAHIVCCRTDATRQIRERTVEVQTCGCVAIYDLSMPALALTVPCRHCGPAIERRSNV